MRFALRELLTLLVCVPSHLFGLGVRRCGFCPGRLRRAFVHLLRSLTTGRLNLLAMLRHIRTSGCKRGVSLGLCREDQERRPNGLGFRLRRVTFKKPGAGPTKSNQKCLLSVGPLLRRGSFTPASLRGPAAIRHPWRGGSSRRIHAARPTPRDLRSACTKVAFGGAWTFCVRKSKADQKRS
jgi:hypothetical protein